MVGCSFNIFFQGDISYIVWCWIRNQIVESRLLPERPQQNPSFQSPCQYPLPIFSCAPPVCSYKTVVHNPTMVIARGIHFMILLSKWLLLQMFSLVVLTATSLNIVATTWAATGRNVFSIYIGKLLTSQTWEWQKAQFCKMWFVSCKQVPHIYYIYTM